MELEFGELVDNLTCNVEETTNKKDLDWEDLFVLVKLLVYKRHPNLNLHLCKCYLIVIYQLTLAEYEELSRKTLDNVLLYLNKGNIPFRNSISFTNMDSIDNAENPK